MTTDPAPWEEKNELAKGFAEAFQDPFEDDTPLECGLEDPEECEACQ